jgi:hypothetical protein
LLVRHDKGEGNGSLEGGCVVLLDGIDCRIQNDLAKVRAGVVFVVAFVMVPFPLLKCCFREGPENFTFWT